MQTIADVMSRDVRVIAPHDTVQRAAQLMETLNVGALPVCDGQRLVGMVTDRDITVRATAAGRAPSEAQVEDVMSTEVRWCYEDEPLETVMKTMADSQLRRVPVISHDEAKRLVGIVALGDLLTGSNAQPPHAPAAATAEKISQPAQADKSGAASGYAAGSDPGVDI